MICSDTRVAKSTMASGGAQGSKCVVAKNVFVARSMGKSENCSLLPFFSAKNVSGNTMWRIVRKLVLKAAESQDGRGPFFKPKSADARGGRKEGGKRRGKTQVEAVAAGGGGHKRRHELMEKRKSKE